MQTIRMAVVGAGSFGRHHVRHLSQHARVRDLVVVDRDAARARRLATMHGVDAAPSLDGLDVDAAIVAVPTEAHAEVALALIERGIHVLIEKPIASSDEEAETIVAAADLAGVVVQVGHVERVSLPFLALAAHAKRPLRMSAVRHNQPRAVPPSADVVLDLMIHDIDLVLALASAPVVDVDGAQSADGHDATARIEFANGAVADLSASRLAGVGERTLTVVTKGATFTADFAAQRLVRRRGSQRAHDVPLPVPHDNLLTELDAFIAAALGERRPIVDGVAGSRALQVANCIRAAAPAPLLLSA